MCTPLPHCPTPHAHTEAVPGWFKEVVTNRSPPPKEDAAQLKAGMYGVVRSLLRALEKVRCSGVCKPVQEGGRGSVLAADKMAVEFRDELSANARASVT